MHLAPVQWGRVTESADRVIILGSGPSVTQTVIDSIADLQDRGVYIIAVNGSATAAPFADAWFTLDPHNLGSRITPILGNKWYVAIPEDFGTVYAREPTHRQAPPTVCTYLHRLVGNGVLSSKFGLCEDPSAVYTGNSAYGALGVAYHMRPKKILMLGVDGSRGYFYNNTAFSGPLGHLPHLFETATYQLQDRGIEVINGSATSTVTCFPRYAPHEAISVFLQ